jgi:hypothetical protein
VLSARAEHTVDGRCAHRCAGSFRLTSARSLAPIASRFAGLIALAVVYALSIVAFGGLHFPLTGDEIHFWNTTLEFFTAPLPSMAALHSYNELNTPLPFVLWGTLHYWLHHGVWLARALNMAASFAVVVLIAWPSTPDVAVHRALAAAGLLMCPYYLFVSAHVYTDMPAIFFATFGLWAYLRGRHAFAAVLFALAIACRQYTVAFPLAIVAHEIVTGRVRRSCRGIVDAGAAAATLAGWVLFFGGIAPPVAIATQGIATAPFATVVPRNALYLIACAGLYFAVPAALLYRRAPRFAELRRFAILIAGIVLLVLFVVFPPLRNEGVPTVQMGLFDRVLHAAGLPDAPRVGVFYLFALAAVISVRRYALALIVFSALVTLKGHLAWDKHALPLVAALWFLASRDRCLPTLRAASSSKPACRR